MKTFSNEELFLLEGREEEKDQLEIEYIINTGSDGFVILSYPKNLSSDKNMMLKFWDQVEEVNCCL